MTKTSRKRNEPASQYFERSTPFGNAGLNLTRIIQEGKEVLDEFQKDLGRKLVESILLMERETVGGTAYHPKPGYKKWSSQQGSVYVGKGKVKVTVPRLRNEDGEVPSAAYESLKDPEAFSEELLDACLSGLSGRRYGEVAKFGSIRPPQFGSIRPPRFGLIRPPHFGSIRPARWVDLPVVLDPSSP